MSSYEKDNALVLEAKTELMTALNDNAQKYLNNMKMWFRQKKTKEEFDHESRKLLNAEQMHLHNRFLVALLNKIHTLSSTQPYITVENSTPHTSSPTNSKKRKRTYRSSVSFEPADIHAFVPPEDCSESYSTSNNNIGLRYAADELFLPDNGLVLGRLLVGAWEVGLTNVDDNAVELIVHAVPILLKNILSSIILRKKQSRITGGGNFYYDVGYNIKNPFVRNSVTRQKIDDEQIDVNKVISSVNTTPRLYEENIFTTNCEEIYPRSMKRISTMDLYKTLMDKNVIPVQSVYSLNMEKISNMLN